MAEETVTLQPGESKQISFEVTPDEARTYQVSVDGLSGSFDAMEEQPLILDFNNISVSRVNGKEFSSIGVDSDNVPFGVLAEKLSVNTLSGLRVSWRNKTIVFGQGMGGMGGMDAFNAGFMVSFLQPGGVQVMSYAPVFFGYSGIQGSPANPFDAVANLRYVIGEGDWGVGDYDAEFEFLVQLDPTDIYAAWTYPPRFRVRNLLHCSRGGSAS